MVRLANEKKCQRIEKTKQSERQPNIKFCRKFVEKVAGQRKK